MLCGAEEEDGKDPAAEDGAEVNFCSLGFSGGKAGCEQNNFKRQEGARKIWA